MTISEKIKQLRIENNLTQEEFAEKIQSSRALINKYESGKLTPSRSILVRIANVFNVSIDYLVTDTALKAPLKHKYDESFLAKLEEVDDLSEEDKNVILEVIDSLIARHKLRNITNAPKVKDIFKKD
jgi:transcriptional regulator with XRE-family HTH domain